MYALLAVSIVTISIFGVRYGLALGAQKPTALGSLLIIGLILSEILALLILVYGRLPGFYSDLVLACSLFLAFCCCILLVKPDIADLKFAHTARPIPSDTSQSLERMSQSYRYRQVIVAFTPPIGRNFVLVIRHLVDAGFLIIVSVLLAFLGTCLILYTLGMLLSSLGNLYICLVPLGWYIVSPWLKLVYYVLFMPGVSAYRRACQVGAIGAQELLRKDTRRPVLLLRSFQDDATPFLITRGGLQRVVTFEEVVYRSLYRYGPLVTFGRPGESFPLLGASRLYIEDEWKDPFQAFLRDTQVVALIIGNTKSLGWEVSQVVKAGMLDRLILFFPPVHRDDPNDHRYAIKERWRSVCESIAKTSGGETLVQKPPAHVKLEEVIIAWFPDGRTPVFLTASARDAETYCSAVRRAARHITARPGRVEGVGAFTTEASYRQEELRRPRDSDEVNDLIST
jgi:hypothetical protein